VFERTVSENGAEGGGMAKGARHRVDEPGSHQWRPDIDKHPRSLIEGWAAATEAVRGRATAELPCTRPRAGGARSTRCTRTAGVCTTVACKSGQGQCQSGQEFSIESSDIVTRQQGHCFSTNFPWTMLVSCGRAALTDPAGPLPTPEKLPPPVMFWTRPDAPGRFIHVRVRASRK
jgi:hypothetical protein